MIRPLTDNVWNCHATELADSKSESQALSCLGGHSELNSWQTHWNRFHTELLTDDNGTLIIRVSVTVKLRNLRSNGGQMEI